MKQPLLLWGIVLCIYSCNTPKQLSLESIFSSHFDHKMISSGPNFPDFNTRKDSIDLFLIVLHEGHSIESFNRKVSWNKAMLNSKLELLKSKDWLSKGAESNPTIFIANDNQGKSLLKYSLPIALEISESISGELLSIKEEFRKLEVAKTHDFASMSFLILSNVLLDNWQINNVEQDFLKTSQRPLRHGKNYHYALLQNETFPKEAFGIYGNQYQSINDSLMVAVYGNNRLQVSQQLRDANFVQNLIQSRPIIVKDDNEVLGFMADNYEPILLSILEKYRSYSQHVYETMGYDGNISFEEFFIWWYHFIYTQATDIMAEKGILNIPEDGNFYYIISN